MRQIFNSSASMSASVALAACGLLVALGLAGCASKSAPTSAKLVEPMQLTAVDTSQKEAFTERFKPHGFSYGGWLDPFEKGAFFKPAQRQHPDSAMVYLYRPDSRWSSQEVIAASIFLNGERLHSLKNNHFYYVELPAGTYRLAIRRPLPPVYFQKGTVVDFTVQAGQDYFLKYAEQHFVSPPDRSLGLLYAKPIMQMPTKQALSEIASTRAKTTGYHFLTNPNANPEFTLPAVSGTKAHGVNKDTSLSEAKESKAGVEFKPYNPLTW